MQSPSVTTPHSLALGTLTSGKNYDVFGYVSGGALTLESLVWTSDTARATAVTLQDGRYLMVYGYRRPPYGVRAIISEDGVTWDVKNEFVIREGGVPGKSTTEKPGSSRMSPSSGRYGGGDIDWHNPGVYQHIGYPSVVQAKDGTIVCSYHEWSDDPMPLQYVRCTHFRL